MKSLAFGVMVLGACTGTGRPVEVVALDGDQPQVGALVVSHRPDGSIIETIQVDEMGRASPLVEDDSLVTAIYPNDGIATRLYTVAVAGHTGELAIHGPTPLPSSDVVGRLDVTAPTNESADDYVIQLACGGYETNPPNLGLFAPQTWPVSIPFPASCIGDDGRVPVIVLAQAQYAPIAYAAGMATLDHGVAKLDVAAWLPYEPNVPLRASVHVKVDWTLWIDGLPFVAPMWGDGGLRWEGLTVDRTSIHAVHVGLLSDQSTDRNVAGVPTEIVLDETDLPAAIASPLALTGAPTKEGVGIPLHFSWESSSVPADVVALDFGYIAHGNQTSVMWSVALPPDATEFKTPAYEGPFAMVAPRDDPANVLRRIDSPDVDGFDEVRAAGIYSLDRTESATVVAPVSAGDLHESAINWASN